MLVVRPSRRPWAILFRPPGLGRAVASCEMCGKETALATYEIEAVQLRLCASCGKVGIPLDPPAHEAQRAPRDPLQSAPQRRVDHHRRSSGAAPRTDVLEGGPLELAEDYGKRIASARNAKGWTQEELGKRLNERKSIITQLEAQTFRPSPPMISRLERVLGVRLIEAVEGSAPPQRGRSGSMTLGDLVSRKRD